MRALIKYSLPTWLFVFCFIVFAGGLGGDFVMDDNPVIKDNSKITDTKFIPDYFTSGVWANTDLVGQSSVGGHSLYRPIFLLTLNIAHQFWGDSTLAYHLLNLTLHSINTVLVYFLILGFISPASRMTAAMSAALFAVHPVHVESVAWIAGITDPLVSIFLLGTFLLHRRWFQTDRTNSKIFFAMAAPIFFALALLSKETAIFFPLILLTYDFLFQRATITSRTSITRYAVYAALILAYFILRSNALGGNAQDSTLFERMDFGNIPTLLSFLAYYFQLLIFPSPLEYYYSPPTPGIFSLATGSLILIGALLYIPRAIHRHHGYLVLAIIWSIVTLLPALPIALFDEPVFAQRVLYLPTVGFSLFVAWTLQQAQKLTRPMEASIKTLAILFLAFFSISSLSEVADWKNDFVFYSKAMKTSPSSYKPVAGLAATYAHGDNKNIDAAVDLYLKAAQLAPREADKLDFQENAARIYGEAGSIEKSEQLYQNIVQQAPKRSSAWVGLGNNALARGNQQQALEFYQKAYEADPSNRVASHNLALVYRALGRLELAARFQRRAQQTLPRNR